MKPALFLVQGLGVDAAILIHEIQGDYPLRGGAVSAGGGCGADCEIHDVVMGERVGRVDMHGVLSFA
jgi:hypothetical protein